MYLAIDIGGTKTLVAVFSSEGKLLENIHFATPAAYSGFLSEFSNNFSKLKHANKLKISVVGAPGKIDRENGVGIAFGNLGWKDIPIGSDIKKITNTRVIVENDANLAGLSEAQFVLKKYKKVLYITVSTGIGGILITNGVIDPELKDMEPGIVMFEHDGKLQRWQDFASGKAIVKKFGRRASEIEDPATWYVISRNLAIGLINAILTLTPDAVIIGGGVATSFDKFSGHLVEELNLYSSDLVNVPPILPAQRPEEAVIYGCYELARQTKL